jgi:hypothetical protein
MSGPRQAILKEVSVQLRRASVRMSTGLSFEVCDLLLAKAWADFHDLRMEVELDCAADGEEYEEMVGLFARQTGFRRWMVWRSCDGIVVQPMVGRPMLFDSLAEALEGLIPLRD